MILYNETFGLIKSSASFQPQTLSSNRSHSWYFLFLGRLMQGKVSVIKIKTISFQNIKDPTLKYDHMSLSILLNKVLEMCSKNSCDTKWYKDIIMWDHHTIIISNSPFYLQACYAWRTTHMCLCFVTNTYKKVLRVAIAFQIHIYLNANRCYVIQIGNSMDFQIYNMCN